MALLDLKLTDCDITFDSENNLEVIIDNDEVGQALKNILQTAKNEWFLNTELGVDWFTVLGQKFDEEVVRLAIVEALFQDNRVNQVEDVTLSLDSNRVLTATATVLYTLQDENRTIEIEVTV